MRSKRALARELADLETFSTPSTRLEQYPTPPELAATLIHRATLDGAITDRTVIDLGTGTGILALAAALQGAARVVGIDIDRDALTTAVRNENTVAVPIPIHWIQAAIDRVPLRVTDATVVMNPPFGAQYAARNADQAFLLAAKTLAGVSYSIHNAGSQEFIDAFTTDHNGTVTHAYEAEFQLDQQFSFHTESTHRFSVEIYRIEW